MDLQRVVCLVDETKIFCDRQSDCQSHDENTDERADRSIYIGLMLAYPDPLNRPSLAAAFDDGHDIAPAAYTAVQQVNDQSDLLGNYTLQLMRFDGGCSVTERTAVGINELSCSCKPIIGIVGPSCGQSAELVSGITRNNQFAMVSIHYGEKEALGDRSKYPYAFGILGSSSAFAEAFESLIIHNKWTKIALLESEDDVDSADIIKHINRVLISDGFKIAYSSRVADNYIPLDELKESFVRVIIILSSPQTVLRALCLAYHQGLVFPAYQWVFKERIISDFHSVSFSYNDDFYSCSEADISSSLRGNINIVLNALSEPVGGINVLDINTTYEEYMMQYGLHREHYTNRFNVPSEGTSWARGIYDAVWSLAFALNDSLKELNMDLTEIRPGNAIVAQTLQKHMLNVKFQGISGRIDFDETGFNIDSQVNIYQYGGMIDETLVGYYIHQNLTLLSNTNPMFIDATFAEERVRVEVYILVLSFVVSLTLLFLVLPVHALIIIYRKHKAIKASSPRLNHMIFLGCYLILVGTCVLILSYAITSGPRSSLCITIPWIITPGTTLIIGTVCMKSWRLYRIYSVSRKVQAYDPDRQICMSDSMLSTGLVVFIAIDIIICLSWTISDPLKVIEHREITPKVDSLPVVKVDQNCESKYIAYWNIIIVAYKAILTLCALVFGLGTRINIKEFNTRNVIILVYTLSIVVGLGIPLLTIINLINSSSTVQFIILNVFLYTVVFVSLFALFYPTITPIIKERHRTYFLM